MEPLHWQNDYDQWSNGFNGTPDDPPDPVPTPVDEYWRHGEE